MTSVEINLDLPMEVSAAAVLAYHEAYPGHHTENVVQEATLTAAREQGERTLRTLNTPEAVVSEGLADVGREVVMSDRELEEELRLIGREVSVDTDWAAVVTTRRALNELNAAVSNAGILLHHEDRSEGEVRAYLIDVGAIPLDRIDHMIRVLNDPVSMTYSFTYSEGVRLIRPWLELQGQTTGFWRLLSEQMSPGALLSELQAAAPVGGVT